MQHQATRGIFAGPSLSLALTILVMMAALWGCQATEEVKQGYYGEHCNGSDLDCRAPLQCIDLTCQLANDGAMTCEQMCDRLESCEADEANCLIKCRNTIRDWSEEAIASFGDCMMHDLTCEQMRDEYSPNLCYQQLAVDAEREDRCDGFVVAARRCDEDVQTKGLRDACMLLARTRTAEHWAVTEPCVARVEDGVCAEIADCFNDVFKLDPALSL